jgi:hypothetical protein
MRTFGSRIVILVSAALAVTVACSSEAPSYTPPIAGAPPAPPAAGAGFAIGAVTPERLSLAGDRVDSQTLNVSYSMPNPSTVTEAQLKLYIEEVGDIATQTVAPAEQGTATFAVDPKSHSIGPWVRFRATCPAGTTDWYTLGQIQLDYDTRMSKDFRIGSVMPQSIRWTQSLSENPDAAQRVKIWGPGLPADCRIEAQVNGRPVELNNVHYLNKQYEGLLLNRDIGNSPISPRYAELKLIINRSGRRIATVKRIAFVEP